MKKQIRAQIAAGEDDGADQGLLRRRARPAGARGPDEERLRPARVAAAVRGDRSRRRRRGLRREGVAEEPRRRRRGDGRRSEGPKLAAEPRAPGRPGARAPSTAEPMLEKLPVAFLAGLISVDHAVRAAARARLPRRPSRRSRSNGSASAARAAGSSISSIPFIVGFTIVFVLLGAGAAAIASTVDKNDPGDDRRLHPRRASASRSSGCCRCPERALAPGLVYAGPPQRIGRAARRRVRGRARRRASAPCSPRSSCSRARAAASRAA